jgi:hypothetical protein
MINNIRSIIALYGGKVWKTRSLPNIFFSKMMNDCVKQIRRGITSSICLEFLRRTYVLFRPAGGLFGDAEKR